MLAQTRSHGGGKKPEREGKGEGRGKMERMREKRVRKTSEREGAVVLWAS